MNRLEILNEQNELRAWALDWTMREISPDVRLVAIACLSFSYETGMDFCAGHSYAKVFAGHHMNRGRYPHRLEVLHATFPMWKTGARHLENVAFVQLAPEAPFDITNQAKLIEVAREMLSAC
jgi:hypothetical protein